LFERTREWRWPSKQLSFISSFISSLTLRSRLLLILLIALTPALVTVVYNEVSWRQSREAEARGLALTYTQLAASEIDRVLQGIGDVLIAVGTAPLVRDLDKPDCDNYLSILTKKLPQLMVFSVTDAEGRVRCSSMPETVGSIISDEEHWKAAVASSEPLYGTAQAGQGGERLVLPVSRAIRDGSGALEAVVVTELDLRWLGARVRARGMPPGGALAIADRKGTIVVREPDSQRFVGATVQAVSLDQMNSKNPGTAELVSQDGTTRFVGYIPPSKSSAGLFVSAGISKATALAPVNRATTINAIILSAGTLAAVTAAWLAGYTFIRRQVAQLVSTIAAWRSGDLGQRTRMEERSGEIESVGASVDKLMDELIASQRERELLNNELRHRVKNTLATVQAIASQTFKSEAADPAIQAFRERLQALAQSHDLLITENWQGADLARVIDLAIRPFQSAAGARITAHGPHIRIKPKAAVSFALAINELCTNALKYGALTRPPGYVEICWWLPTEKTGEDHCFELCWSERSGPPVTAPTSKGFGSRLIEQALAAELSAKIDVAWEAQGVSYTITAPLSGIAAD
jgi:two-component sensor histidine kinase